MNSSIESSTVLTPTRPVISKLSTFQEAQKRIQELLPQYEEIIQKSYKQSGAKDF